jgi:hypothetical protein
MFDIYAINDMMQVGDNLRAKKQAAYVDAGKG